MRPAIEAAARLKHENMLSRISAGFKWCPKCSQRKGVTDFGLNRTAPDGRRGYCLDCERAYKRAADRRKKAAAEKEAARLAEADRRIASERDLIERARQAGMRPYRYAAMRRREQVR